MHYNQNEYKTCMPKYTNLYILIEKNSIYINIYISNINDFFNMVYINMPLGIHDNPTGL